MSAAAARCTLQPGARMQCLQGRAPAATSTSRASSSGSTALPTSSTARPPSARRRVWHCRQLTSPVLCTAGAYREGTSQPSAPAGRPPAGVTEEQVALFRAVKDHQRAGRRSEALALLQDSLALYPTDRNLLALTVSLLLKSNQLTEARTVLLTAQQHHPTHFAFVAAHARLEVRLGHPDAAVSRLEDAMRRYPNNAVLHEVRAGSARIFTDPAYPQSRAASASWHSQCPWDTTVRMSLVWSVLADLSRGIGRRW